MAKKIFIYIFNFILTIFILSLTILLILNNTVLNKQYVKAILQKNDYYERISQIIQKDFRNNVIQSGLEEDVLENLYDKEKVNNDVNMVLDAIYENKKIDIDISTIKDELDSRINNILEQNNRQPGSEEREEIEIFENAIVDAYVNEIVYGEKYVEQIANGYAKIKPVMFGAQIIMGVTIFILIGVILIITKNIKETIKNVAISFLSVGIVEIFIKILIGRRANNILILNTTFSHNLIDLINSTINTIFVTGIIMCVLAIVMQVLLNCENKKIF